MTITSDVAVREEPETALRVPVLPQLPDVDSWIRAMASIAKLADKICDTEFVPAAMRSKPDAVTAAILTGRELGLPPMLALRTINMIKGTPSLSAEYMRSKVLSLGHEFRITEWDDQHCVIHARRKGDRTAPQVIEYTMSEARRAGLIRKNKDGSPGKYETDPMAMMLARATTRTCKAVFGDVINGLATTELLEAGDADAAGAALELPARAPVDVAELRARAAGQTVRAEVTEPRPTGAADAAASAPTAAPAPGQTAPPATPEPSSGSRAYAQDLAVIASKGADLGLDADGTLRVAGKIAGRPVKALYTLRPADAARVAATMEGVADGAALAALLDDIAMGAGPVPGGE
jgi:hypothetical protein